MATVSRRMRNADLIIDFAEDNTIVGYFHDERMRLAHAKDDPLDDGITFYETRDEMIQALGSDLAGRGTVEYGHPHKFGLPVPEGDPE